MNYLLYFSQSGQDGKDRKLEIEYSLMILRQWVNFCIGKPSTRGTNNTVLKFFPGCCECCAVSRKQVHDLISPLH